MERQAEISYSRLINKGRNIKKGNLVAIQEYFGSIVTSDILTVHLPFDQLQLVRRKDDLKQAEAVGIFVSPMQIELARRNTWAAGKEEDFKDYYKGLVLERAQLTTGINDWLFLSSRYGWDFIGFRNGYDKRLLEV